jgi:transaldolase
VQRVRCTQELHRQRGATGCRHHIRRRGGQRRGAIAGQSAQGARVQRPLWASTGTKNPKYSDVLYVEELIGADTVNTVPPATYTAFRDHGKVRPSLEENLASNCRTKASRRLPIHLTV